MASSSETDRFERQIELRAPVSRVWRALSDHHEFGTWFRVKLDRPFAPGAVVQGHLTNPGYEHLKFELTIDKVEPERCFSFRWHPYAVDPDKDYSNETPTTVEFVLEPIATGTRLTVSESGFDALPVERRAEAFRMNQGGWEAQLKNIDAHVRQTP